MRASSLGRRTVRPVRPVLTAFNDEVALPCALVGPVLDCALVRLALSWASEMVLPAWAAVLLTRRSAARRVARLDMWKLLLRNEKARREMTISDELSGWKLAWAPLKTNYAD